MARATVIMGVSGSGKSALAAGVAARLGWRAVDGDDLHAPEAVAKMRAGTALTDADRWPWLDRIGAALADGAASSGGVVVACSALRRCYRDRLRLACPGLRFVFLDGDSALIAARLNHRQGHYMPAALLASQLQTLEHPDASEADVVHLNIALPLETLVEQSCIALMAEVKAEAKARASSHNTTRSQQEQRT